LPELYENPLEFDPTRFSIERAEDKKHKAGYIPFGAGPHRCIGMHYAMMLIKITMFQMLRRYKISLHPSYKDPFNNRPLVMPDNKLPVHLERI